MLTNFKEGNKMKKIIVYLLCSILFIVSFAACTNKKDNVDKEDVDSTGSQSIIADVSENSKVSSSESAESDSETSTETESRVAAWKNAYLKFIEDNKETGDEEYALVYVDNDNVPELFISGCCEAAGTIVCSYKNGKIVSEHLNRLYGASYIPKSGLIFNFNGNMGYYSANVYKLTGNGFNNIFYGEQQEHVIELENEEYDFEYKFFIGEEEVSEVEFLNGIAAVFDTSKSKDVSSGYVSYSKIKQQIKNF